MSRHKALFASRLRLVFSLLIIAAFLLSACAPAATPQAPTQAPPPTEAPTQPPPPTEAPVAAPTEAPTEAAPAPTSAPEVSPTQEMEVLNYSPDIPDPSEPVVVTFASWVHSEGDYWGQMADAFHKIHPNITIEFQDVPFEEMHDKLLTQIAAGNPPDAAYLDSGNVGDFAQRSALVNLEDYIAKSKAIDKKDYVPAFLTAATFEKNMYGLPIDGESTGLFYRTDRFEEAGLDPNKPPTTWEEFQQYAEKLTNVDQKKYGFIVFAPEAAYYWYPWLWQAGGDTLNPKDPNDVIWDSPEGQKAADFYVNLAKYSPADFLNSNSWDGRVAFANGDVAMYVAGAWFAGTLLTEFPDATGKWAAAPLPKDKKCATTIASDDLVVFAASKHPEAAFKWIEFASALEHMAMLNVGTPENPATLLPPRLTLLNDPKLFESRPFLKGFAENMQCAVVSEVVQPKWGDMETVLNEYLGQAFYGKFKDGATAVVEAAKEAEAIAKK